MSGIIVDSYDYGNPRIKEASERIRQLIADAALRRVRRANREIEVALRLKWLDADPPTWRFPGWGPSWRPFDWEWD